MQLFSLFIPWSLIGICYPQFVFSLSQVLEPRLGSTLFDELSLAETSPSDQTSSLNSNLLPGENFPNPITSQSDLDWLPENVDSNGPDPNVLFPNTVYSDESDSSSLFASDDNACDASIATDIQLFGKKRSQGSSCIAPIVGEVKSQIEPNQSDGSNQNEESNPENLPQIFAPLDIFSEDFDLCPPRIFKESNIPVCKPFVLGTYILIPGELYVTLLDVTPRRFYYPPE